MVAHFLYEDYINLSAIIFFNSRHIFYLTLSKSYVTASPYILNQLKKNASSSLFPHEVSLTKLWKIVNSSSASFKSKWTTPFWDVFYMNRLFASEKKFSRTHWFPVANCFSILSCWSSDDKHKGRHRFETRTHTWMSIHYLALSLILIRFKANHF